MKKLLKLSRNLLVLVGWSWLFMVISGFMINIIWNFNFLSVRSWQIFSDFWNRGGILKTTSDILLLLCLLSLPVIWFISCLFALKLNYAAILLWPIQAVYKLFNRIDDRLPERIVLKNIQSDQKEVEEIKAQLESLKPDSSKQAGNIRSGILKKLSEEIKK